ncbi:hypothetical protein JKP88DRAFT_299393 [Tribonema minus]|uniref:Uncharacterized protein n=1 Tax=Tribonema minus TaxID=303371 RepID=A0A836CM02_9STRA|nr:hypothetical protein JKP88DRAFT_299393 [Tribonema minus]
MSPVLLPKQVQSPTRLLRPSLADLVGKEGLSYADARKQIARYTQERHAERARAAEAALRQQQDATYARDVASRAATWGNPTTANAIERLHARDREDAARAALIANSTKDAARAALIANSTKVRDAQDAARAVLIANSTKRKAGKREAQLAAERARRDARADAAQLLHGVRRLLTAGVLDLPQQGLAALPPDVSTTLALQGLAALPPDVSTTSPCSDLQQLGGLRRVNLPRNELKQLLTVDNAALSCAHFRSVTDMNLSGNGLTALPAEMGRCVALQTLRLEQNRLSSLPDSLLRLPCLRRLNLRENSFAALPYAFGELKRLTSLDVSRCLEWLDVSSNMLSALPPTLPLMLALAHLDLDNNSMPHLAIPPALRTTEAGTDAAAAAARRGHDANCEPAEHCIAGLQEGSSAYNKHRTELADRGIFEWSSVPDPETGRVTYLNNVNGDRSDALPACMDRLGSLASLTCLKANRNRLRSLPASVCHCAQLTRLEASRNFLEALPAEMGLLQKLETLLLDKNCLSQLPGSFAKCQRLKELSVASNYFVELPEFCMHLRSLEQLRIGSNQLQRLPYALGLVTTLRELHLHDNPLVDPPASLLLQGTDALLFECRKRYYAQQKGLPPAVGVHQYGIQGEKLALVPEFNAKLQAALDRAAKCGEFHFTMEGLKALPAGLFKPAVAAALTSLRLDTNAIGPGPLEWSKEVPPDPLAPQQKRQRGQPPPGPVTVTFAHLRVLSLKGCGLRDVGDGVRTLTALRELLLERNRLTALPPALLALKQLEPTSPRPPALLALNQLEVLDLCENRIMDLPADVGALARLRQLELSGNRLELLPESICSLRQLAAGVMPPRRCLWSAHLETVLATRVNLHTLTLANNLLAALPTSITALSSLKVLDVDGNRLARLPPGFGALRLEALRAAYNRLEAVSDDALTPNLHASLKRLWLSRYLATRMTDTLAALSDDARVPNLRASLKRLWLSRLEALSDDALTPNLHASLKHPWLSRNNLLELPEAFSLLEGLGSNDLRLELNPLLNPPVEIVAEGTAAVAQLSPLLNPPVEIVAEGTAAVAQGLGNTPAAAAPRCWWLPWQGWTVERTRVRAVLATSAHYCRMRCARLREMAALLLQAGFEADAARLAPEAEDVLTGGTGYLTADDLKQVTYAGFEADAARLALEAEDADAAIDRCVNKAFYRNPLSAVDVADRITALRRDRGREFHEAILTGLRNRLEVHERTQAFPSNAFRRDLTRPWGRRGEGVPCFAITLDALLYEKPAAPPPPSDGAPSLWSETLPTLPPSMHSYTAAAMKKAVAKVRSAYGRAACFDAKVAYEPCECVNWDTGQLIHHPPGTCYSRSLVIAKICYTAEERARRRAEEREMDAEFARVWTEVGTHIASKEGTRQIKAELRKRKGTRQIKAELRKRKLELRKRKALYTVRMGECTAEITTLKLQAKAKREVLTYQELRKTQLMQGMPISFHNLRSLPEANDCIEAATAEAEAAGAALKAATKHYAELQRRVAGMSFAELVDEARAQLVRKYACMRCRELVRKHARMRCREVSDEVEDRHRRCAAKRGLRRPWDGTDGDANHFLEWGLRNDVTVPHRHELPANVQRYAQLPDTMESGENIDGVPLWQRYSWDDTESVELWQEPLYDAWLQHRRLRGSAAAALEDDSGCDSGGSSDDDGSGFDDVPPPPSAEEAATLHSSLHSHASTASTRNTAAAAAPPPPLGALTET